MIPLLLATSLSCSEAQDLVGKMRTYKVEDDLKSEMIQIVKNKLDWVHDNHGIGWYKPTHNTFKNL